jgi:hypothetical protein
MWEGIFVRYDDHSKTWNLMRCHYFNLLILIFEPLLLMTFDPFLKILESHEDEKNTLLKLKKLQFIFNLNKLLIFLTLILIVQMETLILCLIIQVKLRVKKENQVHNWSHVNKCYLSSSYQQDLQDDPLGWMIL